MYFPYQQLKWLAWVAFFKLNKYSTKNSFANVIKVTNQVHL